MATVDIREQLGLEPIANLHKHINMLIYGGPNAGKTYLAATAEDCPDLSPVIHLGFEQGLLTVADRKNYHAKEIRSIQELDDAYKVIKEDQESDKPFFKTLIVDNGTELQNLDKDTIMRAAKKAHSDPDKVDIDVPSPREWGKIGARLRRTVQGLRDLPMHTIWTAWKGVKKDDDGNIVEIYPKLSGFMKEEFNGYFDVVGYLRITPGPQKDGISPYASRFQIQETATVKAKWRNRPPDLPDILTTPTMAEIWDWVQKSRKTATK